jgi:hypothetical protein
MPMNSDIGRCKIGKKILVIIIFMGVVVASQAHSFKDDQATLEL